MIKAVNQGSWVDPPLAEQPNLPGKGFAQQAEFILSNALLAALYADSLICGSKTWVVYS
jgi:hypothetical protein